MKKIVEINIAPYGITTSQFYILMLIKRKGSVRSTQLAELLNVKPSAITVLIDRLAELEYVDRHPSRLDRRVTELELSKKGKEALVHIMADHNELFERHIDFFSLEELEKLLAELQKLENVADKILDGLPPQSSI